MCLPVAYQEVEKKADTQVCPYRFVFIVMQSGIFISDWYAPRTYFEEPEYTARITCP